MVGSERTIGHITLAYSGHGRVGISPLARPLTSTYVDLGALRAANAEDRYAAHVALAKRMKAALVYVAIAHLGSAPGLDIAADTTDWQRFFPLRVANVWEYEVTEPTSQLRREVVGDTLADGVHYFILRESWAGATITPPRNIFVRYDSSGVIVFVDSVVGDTTQYPRPLPVQWSNPTADFHEYFDLRRQVGDTLFIDPDGPVYDVGPWVSPIRIGTDSVETEAKCYRADAYQPCVALDIGIVWAGSLQSMSLTYALLDGIEFGVERLDVDTPEHTTNPQPIVEVYPNPSRGAVSLSYTLNTSGIVDIVVFDPLGRAIRQQRQVFGWPGGRYEETLNLRQVAAGSYFVALRVGGGPWAVRPIQLLR